MRINPDSGSRELDYRLSKWILKNVEQLLKPDEVEKIWQELLSLYNPPTASIENVSGSTDNPLGKYQPPTRFESHTLRCIKS
ncbi:MAG: hypothetical protein Q4G47_05350 [Lachnospiraceae bacterium]|nr:hypothetical protein [Lachnospiraceae bacterium]